MLAVILLQRSRSRQVPKVSRGAVLQLRTPLQTPCRIPVSHRVKKNTLCSVFPFELFGCDPKQNTRPLTAGNGFLAVGTGRRRQHGRRHATEEPCVALPEKALRGGLVVVWSIQ